MWCVVRLSNYAFYIGHYYSTSASTLVTLRILFKHIYSLPLVHRAKCVLLVTIEGSVYMNKANMCGATLKP